MSLIIWCICLRDSFFSVTLRMFTTPGNLMGTQNCLQLMLAFGFSCFLSLIYRMRIGLTLEPNAFYPYLKLVNCNELLLKRPLIAPWTRLILPPIRTSGIKLAVNVTKVNLSYTLIAEWGSLHYWFPYRLLCSLRILFCFFFVTLFLSVFVGFPLISTVATY